MSHESPLYCPSDKACQLYPMLLKLIETISRSVVGREADRQHHDHGFGIPLRPLVSLVDLATQSPYVNVHKIGLGDELIVPDFPEKHCSRQHLALAPHHVFDQKQFPRPEVDRTLTAPDGARQKIEPQRADAEDRFPAVGGWPQKVC